MHRVKHTPLIAVITLSTLAGFASCEWGGGSQNAKNKKEADRQMKSHGDLDVEKEILAEGFGKGAVKGDYLDIHYRLMLKNQVEIDSSYSRNATHRLKLGEGTAIDGLEKGLLNAKKGERLKLVIPPTLAYGKRGVPGFIPEDATLIFEIEVLNIEK